MTLQVGILLALAAAPITDDNWRQHPVVRDVRRVQDEVESLRDMARLKRKRRTFDSCTRFQDDISRTLYTDRGGVPRLYTRSAVSDDTAVNIKGYYDAKARLRYLLVDAGAANATAMRIRIYFDTDGQRLWETRELFTGPGYPFPDPWPDKWIARDAAGAFANPVDCAAAAP
ncbi:MAG: hypothetical protein HY903_11455 [Deltaproteobacteria bacterium]|nr:hypothetical protein [Deltaproteobacteria bacterium]